MRFLSTVLAPIPDGIFLPAMKNQTKNMTSRIIATVANSAVRRNIRLLPVRRLSRYKSQIRAMAFGKKIALSLSGSRYFPTFVTERVLRAMNPSTTSDAMARMTMIK